MITAEQIRAARALINWRQETLANETGLSRPTIKRMETQGPEQSTVKNVQAVKSALEQMGVSFIDNNASSASGGVGVRLSGGNND